MLWMEVVFVSKIRWEFLYYRKKKKKKKKKKPKEKKIKKPKEKKKKLLILIIIFFIHSTKQTHTAKQEAVKLLITAGRNFSGFEAAPLSTTLKIPASPTSSR